MSFGLHELGWREFTFLFPAVLRDRRRPKSAQIPFHGTSARETGECAAADEDAASSTARLGARRDQQISVDILSVMEDD